MQKRYFIELLHKYLKKESSIEEDELLVSYYNLFQSDTEVTSLLSDHEKHELKSQVYAAIWTGIAVKEKREAGIRRMSRPLTRMAAAAVILLITGLYLAYFFHPDVPVRKSPGISAASKKQNRLFHLPDGSMVTLSYGSRLQMSPGFSHAATRDIYLEGQAFFDIHHDASRPFIVHTSKVTTTVLGTAFNVRAAGSEEQITVTVTRGKVKVSEDKKMLQLLTPDQQVVYNKSNGNAVKNKVKAAAYLAWKNEDDLLLDNVTFEEAASLLGERYLVDISFRDKKLKRNRFTTVLLKHEHLDRIMKSICEFNGAAFEYSKDRSALLISSKG